MFNETTIKPHRCYEIYMIFTVRLEQVFEIVPFPAQQQMSVLIYFNKITLELTAQCYLLLILCSEFNTDGVLTLSVIHIMPIIPLNHIYQRFNLFATDKSLPIVSRRKFKSVTFLLEGKYLWIESDLHSW